MKTMIAAAAACALLATGCEDDTDGSAGVVGIDWRLLSLRRPGGSSVIADMGRYTLRFDPDGAIRVRSDCNSCGGQYSLSGHALAVGPLACTRVFCGETSLDPEYARILEGARSVEEDDGHLVLQAAEGALVYTR